MSGNRNVDQAAPDQAARTNQAAPAPATARPGEPLHVDEGDDVVEQMRRQLAEFEERDRQREAELKARGDQVEAERRARAFAEERARDADRQAREAAERGRIGEETGRRTAEDAQLEAIAAGIEAHTGQMNALKAQYAAAGAEGDFVKMADVQAQMAKLGAELVHLENGKSQLESAKARRGAEQQQPGRQADGGGHRDERASQDAYIASMPPLVQGWLRDHREQFFGDQAFRERVAAAANYAQRVRGIPIDSQEYVDFVNQELGLGQPVSRETSTERDRERQPEGERGQPAQPRGREPGRANGSDGGRMTAAPAGGSVAGSARSDLPNNQVYISREEREMARRMGVSESDWAREKAQLEREGLIGTGARRQSR